MYGRSFEDLDGHIWEPMWMDMEAAAAADGAARKPPAPDSSRRRLAAGRRTFCWEPEMAAPTMTATIAPASRRRSRRASSPAAR